MNNDQLTANAFADSWNNLPSGSVYTKDQFEDWLNPLTQSDVKGKSVLELGCGNASLLVHMAAWNPKFLEGVDLGDSVKSARHNMRQTDHDNWQISQADLTEYTSNGFDLVYSIGVLHHLKQPENGFRSVVRNVSPGGSFHCWVYAREGNAIVIFFVDPLRKLVSSLPWWVTKYLVATPLVTPYFLYAKLLYGLRYFQWLKFLPLYEYSLWIAKRNFLFFRHVAFDQLVTPQTTYIDRNTVQNWLGSYPEIDQASTYIIMRNGNSWKFGGRIK
jgi:SAM-dependent methyltransferase